MKRVRLANLLGASLLLLLTQSLFADDDKCFEPLKYSVYATIKVESTNNFCRAFKQFLQRDLTQESLSKMGDSFNIGLPPIGDLPPISLNKASSSDDVRRFKERLSVMTEESFCNQYSTNFAQQVANPTAFTAFIDCLQVRRVQTEIEGSATANGREVVVTLRWNGIGPDSEMPVIKRRVLSGLIDVGICIGECGELIPRAGIIQKFDRTTVDEACLWVSTTRGVCKVSVPKIVTQIKEENFVFGNRLNLDVPGHDNGFDIPSDGTPRSDRALRVVRFDATTMAVEKVEYVWETIPLSKIWIHPSSKDDLMIVQDESEPRRKAVQMIWQVDLEKWKKMGRPQIGNIVPTIKMSYRDIPRL